MRFLWFILAAILVVAPAVAQNSPKPPGQPAASRVALPGPEVLLLLVRTTLIALDHANKTNDYRVLSALGAPALKKVGEIRLGNIFAELRNKKIDLSPVAVVTPNLTTAPIIAPDGTLRLAGVFPTQPLQIQFALDYVAVGRYWRPSGLSVTMVSH